MYRRRKKIYWKQINYHFGFDNEKKIRLPVLAISFSFILLLGVSWFVITKSGKAPNSEKIKRGLEEKSVKGFPPLAKVAGTGIIIYLPSDASKTITIGYHEAENPKTFGLQPIGYCVGNDNPKNMSKEIPVIKGNIPFFILNQRGRGTSATSAVDIVVEPGTEIRSPVDGEVTKIKHYFLYGKYEDFHLEIMPEEYPGLRVAIIHLENLRVKVGDKVKWGHTVLADIRPLYQIQSQIERYSGNKFGHIHLQVNPFVPEQGVPGT